MSSHANLAEAENLKAKPTLSVRYTESIQRRFRNWLWGYDFFISYHWTSGGAYAVALAQRLRDRNFDVFLDRAEFAMGDDWKGVGERALHNTQRLVLVATREAVTVSRPVEHEIKLFTSRGKQVVPIVFSGDQASDGRHSIEALDRSQFPTLALISESQLYIEESHTSLTRGPSDRVIQQLVDTHRVMRRRDRRALAIGLAATLLIAFSLFSTGSWFRANLAQKAAEESRDSEKNARIAEQQQREKAVKQTGIALRELDHARREGFAAQLLRIADVQSRDPTRASDLLYDASMPPDLREMTWGIIHGLGPPEPVAFEMVGEGCLAAGISAGGRFLGATTNEKTLFLWDVATRKELLKLKGREAIAFAQKSPLFATAGPEDVIEIRSLPRGELMRSLKGHSGHVNKIAFSTDDQFLASAGDDRTVRVWNVDDGAVVRVLTGFRGPVNAVAFDRDNRSLFTGSGNTYSSQEPGEGARWEISTGKSLASFPHAKSVGSLSLTPGGKILATASIQDATVKLWDVDSAKELMTLKQPAHIEDVAFNASGMLLAVATDTGMNLHASPSWDLRATFTRKRLRSLAPGPQPELLAVAGLDGLVQLWDLRSPGERNVIGREKSPIHRISLSPDRHLLALISGRPTSGHDDVTALTLWEYPGGRKLATLIEEPGLLSALFSPDGHTLVVPSIGKPAELWDVASRTVRARLVDAGSSSRGAAFSPDGRFVVTVDVDNHIRFWDVATGRLAKLIKFGGTEIYCAAFSPDGRRLAIGGFDAKLRTWDLEKGTIDTIRTGHTSAIRSLAFSAVGGMASASAKEILLWPDTPEPVPIPLRGHGGSALALVFSTDGRTLITGGRDGTIRFWDPVTGSERLSILAHQEEWGVVSLHISSDGRSLLSAGSDRSDGTIRRWNVSGNPTQTRIAMHTDAVHGVAFSTVGSLATASEDMTVRLWNLATGELIDTFLNPSAVYSVAITPDGKILAAGCGTSSYVIRAGRIVAEIPGTLTVWDVATHKILFRLNAEDRFDSLTIDPSGELLVAASGNGQLVGLSLPSAKQRFALRVQGGVSKVRFSASGSRFALIGKGGHVAIHDRSGLAVDQFPHPEAEALAFSPDDTTLVTAGLDNTAVIWDLRRKISAHTIKHPTWIRSVAFSPDGKRLATGSIDGIIRIFAAPRWDALASFRFSDRSDEVSQLTFSHDSHTLYSAGSEGRVKSWDLSSGLRHIIFDGHRDGVIAMALSPDGKRLATASSDSTVKVWDLSPNPDPFVSFNIEVSARMLGNSEISRQPNGSPLP